MKIQVLTEFITALYKIELEMKESNIESRFVFSLLQFQKNENIKKEHDSNLVLWELLDIVNQKVRNMKYNWKIWLSFDNDS